MELHRGPRRLRSAAVITGLLASVLALAGAGDARATQDVERNRIAGTDRFGTAAQVAISGFPDGSDTVVIASGRAFPDALAGAALGLPVLLTERNTLPAATAQAIDSLGAEDALLLGGTAAISEAVASEVAEHATVSRIAGANRYETAAAIARRAATGGAGAIGELTTAIVATGLNFADALAGGPLATGAAGDADFPILLVDTGVPTPTADALEDLGIEQVLILGGTGAVSSTVETELEESTGNPAVRLAGANRYSTATAIGEYAIDTLGFPAVEALLASGLEFADALAGGPLGGARRAPLVLTDPAQLSPEAEEFLAAHSATIATITTLGGSAAVSESTASAAETAAETPPDTAVNEGISVTPTQMAVLANGESREYIATGLTGAVDIALVPCAYVTTASDGSTNFSNSNKNTIADGAADGEDPPDTADAVGFISEVNGDARIEDDPLINPDYADDASPTSGRVEFTVEGPADDSNESGCLLPVVFYDDNNDDAMNVPDKNPAVPTEEFGTGGRTSFSPSAATSGSFFVNVDEANIAADYFVGCDIVSTTGAEIVDTSSGGCRTYRYDSTDTFQRSGAASTLTKFEAVLTQDDNVRGTFNPNPSGRSTFNFVEDETPAPPSPEPERPDDETPTQITIRFIESNDDFVTLYRLYRAEKGAACPPFSGSAYREVAEVNDQNPNSGPPSDSSEHTIIDDSDIESGQPYCYYLVSVEGSQEGEPSDLIERSGGTGDDSSAPVLEEISATSDDDVYSGGDTITLEFDDVIAQQSLVGAEVEATGDNGGQITAQCGTTAVCALDSDDASIVVMSITVVLNADREYPLTLTGISGFENTSEVEVSSDPADAAETEIENTSEDA